MNINRDLGASVFTWTDVVTGITNTRTEFSRGSAYTKSFSDTEVAWTNGTITLAQSSANTGTQNTAQIYLSAGAFPALNIVAVVNGTSTIIAHN